MELRGSGHVEAVGHISTDPQDVGATRDLPAGLVVYAVGYTGSADAELVGDTVGTSMPHEAGREPVDGERAPALHGTGWAERGDAG